MAIAELRPGRSDIIMIEEGGVPLLRIKHETVPLNDKAMVGSHMFDEPAEHEFRIGAGRDNLGDRDDFDGWVQRLDVRVGEQQTSAKFDLTEGGLKGQQSCRYVYRTDRAKGHRRKGNPSHECLYRNEELFAEWTELGVVIGIPALVGSPFSLQCRELAGKAVAVSASAVAPAGFRFMVD